MMAKIDRSSLMVLGGAIVLMALAPSLSFYLANSLILLFLFAYLSTSWNILSGLAGQLSFGSALFFGVGAYTSSVLLVKYSVTPWIGMIVGGFVAVLVALFLGYLTFRFGLRGFFFGLMTIMFTEVARIITLNIEWLGAARGLYIPFTENNLALLQFTNKFPYLYVILLMYVAAVLFTKWIMRLKLGTYLVAIREDQDGAAGLGVNTFKYKMIAIAITAFMTSLGGSFFAHFTTFIDPYVVFNFTLSIEIVVFAIAGGAGTLFGPLAGAALLIPMGEFLRARLGSGAAGGPLLLYGLLLIIAIRYMPDGIVAWVNEVAGKFVLALKKRGYEPTASEPSE